MAPSLTKWQLYSLRFGKKLLFLQRFKYMLMGLMMLCLATNTVSSTLLDGSLDESFMDPKIYDIVNSFAIQDNGKIVIGGWIITVDGVAHNHIARLHANGSLDTTFNPGSGANDQVYSIAIQADGKVVIGGSFTRVNGIPRNRIARLHANGRLDTTFNPGLGTNNTVNSITIQTNGRIILGGEFTEVNGVARNRIARLRPNGSLDNTFNPGSGANGSVYSIAIQADGKIVMGGKFAQINGSSRKRIARLHTNGSLDTTFDPGAGPDALIYRVAIQANGKIIMGGNFTQVNNITRNKIARLNAGGSLDTTFNPGAGTENGNIHSVAIQADGKIVIGGNFTKVNNIGRKRIARLHTNGSLDTIFDPGAGTDNTVNSIAIQADGKIVIGGRFNFFDGHRRQAMARLESENRDDTICWPIKANNGTIALTCL